MRDYAAKLTKLRAQLEEYETARSTIIATGQSWRLRNGEDNREMTNVSLAQLNVLIADIERQIEQIESLIDGNGNPSGVRISARVL